MADWVDSQVAVYRENRFIVTSRPAGYDTATLKNKFFRLDVQDFDQADIEQFCHKWCLAVELAVQDEDNEAARRRATDAANDLIQAIGKNKAHVQNKCKVVKYRNYGLSNQRTNGSRSLSPMDRSLLS
jgi:predicted NACHT family NTPase